MSSTTGISWTDSTWNVHVGCSPASPGCANCYARATLEIKKGAIEKFKHGFDKVVFHPKELATPASWRKPRKIFVNSMSDLFHESIPDDEIKAVFAVMNACKHHTFQVLTKRSKRMCLMDLEWTPNIWAGVTVENPEYLFRMEDLRSIPAKVRFISAEPLLADLGVLDLEDIHWMIVGGESGPKDRIRPMRNEWVTNIERQCREQKIAFFFKQWGGWQGGDMLWNGKEVHEWPAI